MRQFVSLRPTLLIVLLCTAVLSGCRTVAVQSDPAPTYMVDVQNAFTEAMTVYFDDGRGQRLLGTVGPQALERFIVAAPAVPQVAIIATNRDGTRTFRRDVVLQPGIPVNVLLDG